MKIYTCVYFTVVCCMAVSGIESFRMDKHLAVGDKWALDLIGNRFKFKDLELEDDQDFRSSRPFNVFRIRRR